MKNVNESGTVGVVDDVDDFDEKELVLPENYEQLSPLEKGRAIRIAKKEAGWDVSLKTPMEKAKLKPTPMNCIKAKCYECMGGDVGWKWQIGNCTSSNCPLYPIRPHQTLLGTDKPRVLT